MEVEILHLGEVKFEAIARPRVICDQPDPGRFRQGMTPPDVSIGIGWGRDAGFYAAHTQNAIPACRRTENQGYRGKGTQPARIGRLQVFVTIPELNPKDQAGHSPGRKICLITPHC